eukprot:CAMPEP_0115032410 /NCGR_PEP_ID=MMETSP0216-20121206/39143_1 /TAXON_ID=223996 /ORGANISM="Protocruzia adherens, Strain Boccale" /LENGTH=137 /DNA_ID=CAMNT_0002410307 /DNA_START=16 /DNA_END=429 /DNA_ORIENTATION=-
MTIPDWYLTQFMEAAMADDPALQIVRREMESLSTVPQVQALIREKLSRDKGEGNILEGKVASFAVRCDDLSYLRVTSKTGVWAVSAEDNEQLANAFIEYDHVILILVVSRFKRIRGFARMASMPLPAGNKAIWGSKT